MIGKMLLAEANTLKSQQQQQHQRKSNKGRVQTFDAADFFFRFVHSARSKHKTKIWNFI